MRTLHTAFSFGIAMLCASHVLATTLLVGPGRTLARPSDAAAIAADGDIVRIDPGMYSDCAIWTASHLVIEADGPGVRLAGRTCSGKGIFVTEGADITIRGITFADAAVASHNGAGIRAGGDNLTVVGSRFLNNENGILAGGGPNSVVRVADSEFIGNGACIGACAHGVYAGAAIRSLEIDHCVFRDTRIGHHIKSRARNTIVRDSTIEDGPDGTSSYLIEVPNGGDVLIQGNTLQKGPHSSNHGVAISIGVEGVKYQTDSLIIRNNRFRNDTSARTMFVRNSTGTPVTMDRNAISGQVDVLVNQPARR